jgi:hypothetical protein
VAWVVLRTVIEEKAVSDAVDRFSVTFSRFDEAWDALRWLLARDPAQKNAARYLDEGVSQRSMVYVQAGDPIARTPDIWVVYTYTDGTVTIMGINAVEARAEEGD